MHGNQSDLAYYIVLPKVHLEQPAVIAFKDWVLVTNP